MSLFSLLIKIIKSLVFTIISQLDMVTYIGRDLYHLYDKGYHLTIDNQ